MAGGNWEEEETGWSRKLGRDHSKEESGKEEGTGKGGNWEKETGGGNREQGAIN